ncbi:hypothetical protein Q7O_003849 [Pectobacterium carotovorum subsp. carotovorum PCCS1]|nr:hypothetical protein [Pectobacterium carotovorum subsp. carotovorum PCCS1]
MAVRETTQNQDALTFSPATMTQGIRQFLRQLAFRQRDCASVVTHPARF